LRFFVLRCLLFFFVSHYFWAFFLFRQSDPPKGTFLQLTVTQFFLFFLRIPLQVVLFPPFCRKSSGPLASPPLILRLADDVKGRYLLGRRLPLPPSFRHLAFKVPHSATSFIPKRRPPFFCRAPVFCFLWFFPPVYQTPIRYHGIADRDLVYCSFGCF